MEEADTDELDGYEEKVEGKKESAIPSKLGRMHRGAEHSPVAAGGGAMNSPSEKKVFTNTGPEVE